MGDEGGCASAPARKAGSQLAICTMLAPRDELISDEVFGSCRIPVTRLERFEMAVHLTREAASETLRVNELCWRSHALVYATGCHRDWTGDLLREFCRLRGIVCTARTERNPFLPLVKAVYLKAGWEISDSDASRYARALMYLRLQNVESEQAFNFLRDKGGISGCLKLAARATKTDTAAVKAPVIKNDAECARPLSPKERELIDALRLQGEGSFVCRVVRDAYGMQHFSIDVDAEGNSIAAFKKQGARAIHEPA